MPDGNAAPCDECPFAISCRLELIACREFFMYSATGKYELEPGEVRKPSKKYYNRCFRQKVDK